MSLHKIKNKAHIGYLTLQVIRYEPFAYFPLF